MRGQVSNVFENVLFPIASPLVSRHPTIADVAAAAGVSMATVSKAVNGRYGVRKETQERVLEIARRLGYESSLVASSMRSHRGHAIGILVPAFEPFTLEVLKGVGEGLKPTGLELLAYTPADRGDRRGWEQRSLSRLSGSVIAGAILVTPTVLDVRRDIPLVAVDPHTGPAGLPVVESDNFAGARAATTHLVELGHRRIALLAGRPDLRSSLLREAGYRRALEDAGLRVDPALIRSGDYETESSWRPAAELLGTRDRPTAVFAANDLSAIAIVETAAALGIRIPDELSVVGFDDIPEAARMVPALTTVRQSMHTMGSTAAALLIAQLERREPDPTSVVLPTRLVRRATTAPPAG